MEGFVLTRAGTWTFYFRPEFAEPAFAGLCSLPRSEFPAGVIPVASSEHTEVRRFDYGGRGFYLKEYIFLNWKKHLKVLRRGEHLVRVEREMGKYGFLTPRIAGIGRRGKERRVVTEAVENARDIWQVLFPEENRYRGNNDDGFVHALGRTIGQFHSCGFFHGDLRWRNVLCCSEGGQWKYYFIDNDRTTRFRLGIPLRYRAKNLSQILFSGLLLHWPQTEWNRFLTGYFENSGLPASFCLALKRKVEQHAQARFSARLKSESRS